MIMQVQAEEVGMTATGACRECLYCARNICRLGGDVKNPPRSDVRCPLREEEGSRVIKLWRSSVADAS